MTRIPILAIAFALFIGVSRWAFGGAVEVLVDAIHEGTFASPTEPVERGAVYRTIQEAADACAVARAHGRWAEGGVLIEVRQTEGLFTEPVRLGAEHSGAPGGPLIIRGTADSRPAPGGRVISRAGEEGPFRPVTDEQLLARVPVAAHDHLLQADLFSLGFSNEAFGTLSTRGFGRSVKHAHMEVLANGRVMPLAEWPNEGWATIEGVPEGQDGGMFTVAEKDRLARWQHAEDLWVHGYWTWDWADSYEAVDRINPDTGAIYTKEPHGAYGYKKGQRWRALNLLEELDRPGEWYLDRERGVLYWWPPEDIAGLTVSLSMGESAFLVEKAANLIIEGFLLEGLRGTAIVIRDSREVSVRDCVIRAIGNRAVAVSGGSDITVANCDISQTGDGGIALNGGNRQTLVPARHVAINNHVQDYSRWCRTYRPAVQISGVGNRAAHNKIHNAPHNGIQLSGNDHVIEFNELFDICKDTGDVGAFYAGRNWTARGTVIQHNYFHDIEGPYTHGAMGVYLDDAVSGFTIRGNVFKRASRAMFIGGGRDNLVVNNLFIDCAPSVHVDARGLGWAQNHIKEGGGWRMYEKLREVNYTEPPYSERYPELVAILEEQPHHPMGNAVRHNISVGGRWLDLQGVDAEWVEFGENLSDATEDSLGETDGLPHVKDEARPDWFEDLPVMQIGLKDDVERPSQRLLP